MEMVRCPNCAGLEINCPLCGGKNKVTVETQKEFTMKFLFSLGLAIMGSVILSYVVSFVSGYNLQISLFIVVPLSLFLWSQTGRKNIAKSLARTSQMEAKRNPKEKNVSTNHAAYQNSISEIEADLEKLNQMLEKGLIEKEEFLTLKDRVINQGKIKAD